MAVLEAVWLGGALAYCSGLQPPALRSAQLSSTEMRWCLSGSRQGSRGGTQETLVRVCMGGRTCSCMVWGSSAEECRRSKQARLSRWMGHRCQRGGRLRRTRKGAHTSGIRPPRRCSGTGQRRRQRLHNQPAALMPLAYNLVPLYLDVGVYCHMSLARLMKLVKCVSYLLMQSPGSMVRRCPSPADDLQNVLHICSSCCNACRAGQASLAYQHLNLMGTAQNCTLSGP